MWLILLECIFLRHFICLVCFKTAYRAVSRVKSFVFSTSCSQGQFGIESTQSLKCITKTQKVLPKVRTVFYSKKLLKSYDMYQRKTLTMIAGSCVKHFLAKRTLADERLLVKKPGRGQGYATRLYLCINKNKIYYQQSNFLFYKILF